MASSLYSIVGQRNSPLHGMAKKGTGGNMHRVLLIFILAGSPGVIAQPSRKPPAEAVGSAPAAHHATAGVPVPLGMEHLNSAPWGPLAPEYGFQITANGPSPIDLTNRGFYQLQLFRSPQATKHFLAALNEDRRCAMAWVGLYLSLLESGDTNGPIRSNCLASALALRDKCHDHEQVWIDALAALDKNGAGGFAVQLEKIRQEYPDDHNARIWLPLMLRDGFETANMPRPGQRAAEALLHSLLVKRPGDPVVLHAWCQLALVGPKPESALGQAGLLLGLEPPSAYFRQAAGMVLFRCGDLGGATAAFDSARQYDEASLAAEGIAPAAAPTYFDNLDCLVIALVESGRRNDALAVARATRDIQLPWDHPENAANREFALFTLTAEARIQARCGDWAAARAALPAATHPAIKAWPLAGRWIELLDAFCRGQQAAAANDTKALHKEVKACESLYTAIGTLAAQSARAPVNPRAREILPLCDMLQYQLRAEEKLLAGDKEAAEASWRLAAAIHARPEERAVPRWPCPVTEVMATALARHGDLQASLHVWEQAGRENKFSGWAKLGLCKTQRAAGDAAAAKNTALALGQSWHAADADLLPPQ